jgi:dihydrofolate synthase/folylpolyglutamate synthase
MTPDRNPWLESLIRPNSRPYSERAPLALESVGRLLDRLGNPQQRLRVIHIAGSKGKGSTALMVEGLLQASGLRAGTFTSPHLERWSERFRIGGQEISETDLEQAINALKPHVDTLSRQHPKNPPSFFDVLTAMALWLFERRGVDVAIMETGIGGRFDATNVVQPEVACITNVELEHTDKLGTDLATIAWHKAGILKPGAVAVLGSFGLDAGMVMRENVEWAGCKAARLGQDFEIRRGGEDENRKFIYRSGDIEIDFRLTHPGWHMAENAALAITCVAKLNGIELPRLRNAVSALAHVALPGRTEILRTEPWWIVDAAHTQRSIAALADVLDTIPASDRHFVISLSGDKPVETLAPLLDTAASITVTSPEPLRSTPAPELGSRILRLYPEKDVNIETDVASALERATSRLGSSSLVCATGSTYIAGAARRLLRSSV